MAYSFIDEWLNDKTVDRFSDKDGNFYGIRILSKGETLFFQRNNIALLCEIDASNAVIFRKSISKWLDGKKIKATEKEYLVQKIEEYYKIVYNKNVIVM